MMAFEFLVNIPFKLVSTRLMFQIVVDGVAIDMIERGKQQVHN